jgi:hypothetical protein
MKFEQGHYTLSQMEDMIKIHSNGTIHIVDVWQEGKQLAILTSNNIRFKIRMI